MGGNAVYLTRNKKCIFNLAKKNFGKSKTRNIITILAIILTTMLFTSMLTICTGTYQSIQTTMQMQKGSKADGDIRYLTKNEFEQLQENSNIKVSGCRRPIGFASNTKNHNVEIDYMDQIEQELTFNRPTHGKAPKKANEIATTDKALESLGVTPKVGEKVRIEFDLREEHYVYEMTVSGWWEARNSQVSVLLVSEEFMNKNESLFPYTYDEDMEYAGTYFSEVIFESKKNVEQQINKIIEGFNEQKGKDVVSGAVNSITNPQLDFSVIGAVIIFIVLFILAGYLLINNIYSISAMQDIKNYGLLKTIGTTKSQIALLVKIQTLWLLVLGIPVGLVTGDFIGKSILPFAVNTIASEYLKTEIVIAPNPLIFVVATIFTIVTVKISIGKPLRTISKISPLVAIRETGIRKNKKKKKTHKFSIIKMANDNFRRNKKRSIFIVISIALCCVFFNSVFILANSISIEKGVELQSAADIEIGSGNLFNNLKGYTRHSDGLEPQVIDSIKANFKINAEGIIYKNTLDDLNVTDQSENIAHTWQENGFERECVIRAEGIKKSDFWIKEIYQEYNSNIRLEDVIRKIKEHDLNEEQLIPLYQENWNKNINTLSGGEKQIVSILKCLVKEADMIIFDEPTSNLDIKRINALLRLIERLKMEKKILLIVSHDSEIIQASDIIIRLGNIQH